jgi:hypothetical protein
VSIGVGSLDFVTRRSRPTSSRLMLKGLQDLGSAVTPTPDSPDSRRNFYSDVESARGSAGRYGRLEKRTLFDIGRADRPTVSAQRVGGGVIDRRIVRVEHDAIGGPRLVA